MAEYIKREVCLSILRATANMAVLMDAAPYFEKAAQMLEKLPADDVAPVVRCKDCRKFKTYACRMVASGYDDFCSYGERKDDEHEH